MEVGLSLKEEKKVCRPSPHTKLGKKTSSCRKIGMSEVLSLSLAGSAFDPLPALYYKTATYLFLVFMLRQLMGAGQVNRLINFSLLFRLDF